MTISTCNINGVALSCIQNEHTFIFLSNALFKNNITGAVSNNIYNLVSLCVQFFLLDGK